MMDRDGKTGIHCAREGAQFRRALRSQRVLVVEVREIEVVRILKRHCDVKILQRFHLVLSEYLEMNELRSNIVPGVL